MFRIFRFEKNNNNGEFKQLKVKLRNEKYSLREKYKRKIAQMNHLYVENSVGKSKTQIRDKLLENQMDCDKEMLLESDEEEEFIFK